MRDDLLAKQQASINKTMQHNVTKYANVTLCCKADIIDVQQRCDFVGI